MCVRVRLHFSPGHIYVPILKQRVPMDSPWPRDEYKNIKFQNYEKTKNNLFWKISLLECFFPPASSDPKGKRGPQEVAM